MTSILPVSVPASGVSARPTAGVVEEARARVVGPAAAPQERRPEGDPRERREAARPSPAVAAPLPPAPELLATAAPEPAAAGRSPLERASDAYRKAGAEPPHYSDTPRVFSVTA